MKVCAALAWVFACTGTTAGAQATATTYDCDRGVAVPAVYVTDTEGTAIVVLYIEGRLINLVGQDADGGVRYSWPGDGSNYVWWTRGTEAALLWHDATDNTEPTLLERCRAQ